MKSKIRKGKPAGREDEETTAVKPEQGTDLLCCVPGRQGTVDISYIDSTPTIISDSYMCGSKRYIVIIVPSRQAILSAPRESLKIPTQQ